MKAILPNMSFLESLIKILWLKMDEADTMSALERLLAKIIPCSVSIDLYTYPISI